ncbi:MAG: ATP-binding protein [Devosia sp.]|nr:ATP-binding protein [Devosia sp.]
MNSALDSCSLLAVLEFDEHLTLVSAAHAFCEDQIILPPLSVGSPLSTFFTPAEQAAIGPLAEAALAGRKASIRIERLCSRNADRKSLDASLFPRLADGRHRGVVLTLQDMTSQQAAAARTEALEDRLRAILNCAADAIIVIDVDGAIEGANSAAERLTGWTQADLIGQPIRLLMDEPYRSSHQIHIERYLQDGSSGILNVGPRPLPLLHKEGGTIPVELSVGEAFIAGERKFIGVCRDIRQRLAKDEALRAANVELRKKIAELEIASERMEAQKLALQEHARETQRAWEAADAANQAKSRFVATMSHELRTPLNGILAVADALSKRNLGARDLELVQIIRSSGRGLLSILNEVLDLARVEAGALLTDHQPFSPSEAVTAVAEVWRFAAEAKGIELLVKIGELPDFVGGDALRLRQVLSNLVNNAIKFTEAGAVELNAGRASDTDTLRFEVIDSGPGIDEAMRERLFEPFVQADASTTRKHGGTGLGLTICRELVTLMGGRIWAESAERGGAAMIVEIPFDSVKGQAPTGRSSLRPDEPASAPASAVRDLDPLILVAEDHPLNRLVVSIVLDAAQLRYEFAEDGEAAVAMVSTGRFDIVLMDVNMPRMDGLDATRAIRHLPRPLGAIPIIAVSANTAPGEVAACREAGMDAVVAKPIEPDDLLERISQRLLAGQGGSRSSGDA